MFIILTAKSFSRLSNHKQIPPAIAAPASPDSGDRTQHKGSPSTVLDIEFEWTMKFQLKF